MAASLLGGAAVGTVFGELLKAVLEMKDKVIMFKPTLAKLSTILTATAPVIDQIEQHNNDLGRPKGELELLVKEMEEGTQLVYNSSKIHKLNFYGRIRYQEQLAELLESLKTLFMTVMLAQMARDVKEGLLEVKRMRSADNKQPSVITEETVPVTVKPVKSSLKERYEEATESEIHESKSTQAAKDAKGTNFAEQVMEDIASLSQKTEADVDNSQATEHLMSEKSYKELREDEKINRGSLARGAVFGELLRELLGIGQKASDLENTLARLSTIIGKICPAIEEIIELNKEMGREPTLEVQSLMSQVHRYKMLVYEVPKVHKFNFLARTRYSHQLAEVKDFLLYLARFFMTRLQDLPNERDLGHG